MQTFRMGLFAAAVSALFLVAGCGQKEDGQLGTVTSPPPEKPGKEALKRLDDLAIPLIMQGAG
ncbi:MAG: hypothetical protein V3V49_11760, partial [Candidatus Krumholzibacteria bacterium]